DENRHDVGTWLVEGTHALFVGNSDGNHDQFSPSFSRRVSSLMASRGEYPRAAESVRKRSMWAARRRSRCPACADFGTLSEMNVPTPRCVTSTPSRSSVT